VIHRFMPAERMAAEVKRVKRAESYVVEAPATITPRLAVADGSFRTQIPRNKAILTS